MCRRPKWEKITVMTVILCICMNCLVASAESYASPLNLKICNDPGYYPLHMEPSSDSRTIGYVPAGRVIQAIEAYENGWFLVECDDTKGFLLNEPNLFYGNIIQATAEETEFLIQYGQSIRQQKNQNTEYQYTVKEDGTAEIAIASPLKAGEELIIPERIDGYPVTSIAERGFENCISVTKVIIPSSVKSIGNFAFAGCIHLTDVTLPSSVKTIGSRAFSLCPLTEEFHIPEGVTSICLDSFRYCKNLERLYIPGSLEAFAPNAPGIRKGINDNHDWHPFDQVIPYVYEGSNADNWFHDAVDIYEGETPEPHQHIKEEVEAPEEIALPTENLIPAAAEHASWNENPRKGVVKKGKATAYLKMDLSSGKQFSLAEPGTVVGVWSRNIAEDGSIWYWVFWQNQHGLVYSGYMPEEYLAIYDEPEEYPKKQEPNSLPKLGFRQ